MSDSGSPVSEQIITPTCRTGRGNDGAWDEAVRRLREQYDAIVQGWAGTTEQPTLRLVLTMERP